MKLATLLLVLLLPATAAARWPTGSTRRLAAAARTVTDAAEAHGLAPELLGAVLVTETGVQGIPGASAPVWGPGQVSQRWVEYLARRGYLSPGEGPEAMLDVVTGIWCAAAVLGYYSERVRGRGVHLVLSDYAMGEEGAKEIQVDSEYSREVVGILRRVRGVLAAGLAMRGLCGNGGKS